MNTIRKFVCLGLIVTGGCLNAQVPVSDKSISQNNHSDNDRLATLERLINASAQRQLQVQQQFDELLEEVNQLRGETEVHGRKLEQLVERQRELYQELEDRFSRVQAQSAQMAPTLLLDNKGQVSNVNDVIKNDESDVTVPNSDEQYTQLVYSADIDENQAYDSAMNLVLKERKYEQAIPEFKKFIATFPDSQYTPNAHYWLGQLLFNKGNYLDAKPPFERVVNFYPDSNKRSDALYKLGSIALKTNQVANAKRLFQQVLSEYPDSISAEMATSRLNKLRAD